MKELKQSMYNVLFDDSGRYYLYNTLSVGIVELDSETYKCFKEDDISAICPDYIPTMQEMHFLVEKNADEPENIYIIIIELGLDVEHSCSQLILLLHSPVI